MENRIKIKLGTSDKVILGIGYTLLGVFVLAIAMFWQLRFLLYTWSLLPLWIPMY